MRRCKVTDFPTKSTNEIISRHLASNLHIGMSRDLTTALKDGCIDERQMAQVCKKHKCPEGQQMAHILTLNMYQATTLRVSGIYAVRKIRG